jgi:hypothetical protein
VALTLAFGFSIDSANALIVLSGDTNVTDALVGDQGFPIDTGNQQFFTNILQDGSSVAILENGGGIQSSSNVNDFYNSLSGVSSNVIVGTVTDITLVGVDLFVSAVPDDAYTASEITALDSLLAGGGSIFFLGENSNGGWPLRNGYINDALSVLGSGLSIIPDSIFGTGIETATGAQIATDPLTDGVTTFTYGVPSEVSGGTHLFLGTAMQPFVAYEQTVIPIPPAVWLFGSGLLGLAGIARRKKQYQ